MPRVEPERYELGEAPRYHFELGRRDWFKALGAGLLVVAVADPALAQESGGGRPRGNRPRMPQELGPWLHIGEDGKISAYTGKAEVGQNTRTALVQGIAEELRVSPSSIQLIMADTDRTPFDAGTFGSRSMPDMLPQVRKAGAAARELLLDRAAAVLGGDRTQYTARDGRIFSKEKSIGYGELVKGQQIFETASIGSAPLTPANDWRLLGKPLPKVDGAAFVTGNHKYVSDLKLPGMLYGAIVRPPAVGATLVSIDTPATQEATVVRDREFVGVAASSAAKARSIASELKAEWKVNPQPSDSDLYTLLKNSAKPRTESTKGSIEEGFKAADRRISATYTVAYIAHAPLEPRAAVASWEGGKLTVWTGTQRPFGVRSELASAFSIPESQVRVIVPDTGSGYGGKHTGEAAVEAARLAKAAGKPVKLVWTREEEFSWAYLRPAGVIEVESGVDQNGLLTAWDFHNYNSGGSGIQTLYEAPHQRVHFHQSASPLRQGSYRGLAATANHFAREVHMDEIAQAIGRDPLAFRLQNLKDPRLRTVFERAAEAFGWGKRTGGSGRGVGMGGGFEKGGYVATFAEVSAGKDLKRVRVERVVTAFECGAIVNPDCLRNQVEGGVIMGLGGALFEKISFQNGRILNGRFSHYRVPRFADIPVVETVLVDRKDLPSAGAGETPIVGIAPAIANAIWSATGLRLRSLPLLGPGVPSKPSA